MKTAIIITSLLISACSANHNISQSPPSDSKVIVNYFQSRNDIQETIKKAITTIDIEVKESNENSTHHIDLPLSYAVFCKAEKTDCKHAAVKSTIKYKITKGTGKALLLNGTFFTEMGRSKSWGSSNSMTVSSSVPNGIPVISEEKKEYPLFLTLTVGQKVEIHGISGDRVILHVQ